MGARPLNQQITAIVSSLSGAGYLLVSRDGGTFAYGDYPFPGSLTGIRLAAPVVDAAVSVDHGLWMLAEGGGIFSLSAPSYGAATAEANPAPPGTTVSRQVRPGATAPGRSGVIIREHGGDAVVTAGPPAPHEVRPGPPAALSVCG
jgi:hypothetical protein